MMSDKSNDFFEQPDMEAIKQPANHDTSDLEILMQPHHDTDDLDTVFCTDPSIHNEVLRNSFDELEQCDPIQQPPYKEFEPNSDAANADSVFYSDASAQGTVSHKPFDALEQFDPDNLPEFSTMDDHKIEDKPIVAETVNGEKTENSSFSSSGYNAAYYKKLEEQIAAESGKKTTMDDFYKYQESTDFVPLDVEGKKIAFVIGILIIVKAAASMLFTFYTGSFITFISEGLKIAASVLFIKGNKFGWIFLIITLLTDAVISFVRMAFIYSHVPQLVFGILFIASLIFEYYLVFDKRIRAYIGRD